MFGRSLRTFPIAPTTACEFHLTFDGFSTELEVQQHAIFGHCDILLTWIAECLQQNKEILWDARLSHEQPCMVVFFVWPKLFFLFFFLFFG